jgi:hypothetical protein
VRRGSTSPEGGSIDAIVLDPVTGSAENVSASAYSVQQPPWDNAPSEAERYSTYAVGRRYTLYFGGVARTLVDERAAGLPNTITYGDGQLFDEETGQWRATNPDGAPSPRFFAKIAAVNDRFFVWGGFAEAEDTTPVSESELRDGAIYDPESDTWASVSDDGAPPQTEGTQYIHAPSAPMKALHAGNHVIVLGGATVGLYDVASDRWRTLEAALGVNGHLTAGGNYLDLETSGGPTLLDVDAGTVAALPFSAFPTTASEELQVAASNEPGFRWYLDAWTGSKLVRWAGTTQAAVGCDNLPPDFMGGCDPAPVTTVYQGGGVLMLEE